MHGLSSFIEISFAQLHLLGQEVSTDIACNTSGGFFQFPTWYEYVCGRPFVFPTDIPLILLAVVEILLRVAGIAAIAYVIFGGVKYTVSQGEPDKINEAKGTVINALVGLAMATLAIAIVSFIGARVG